MRCQHLDDDSSLAFKSSSCNALPFVVRLAGIACSFLAVVACHRQQTWSSRPNVWTLPTSSKELQPQDPVSRQAEAGLASGAACRAMGLTFCMGQWTLGAKMEGSLKEGCKKASIGWARVSLPWACLTWCLAGILLVGQTCGNCSPR